MKKLVVFGDSFVAQDLVRGEDRSLIKKISEYLNVPVLNTAISGSSMQFAILEFLKYTKSENYDPEDYIIVAITGPDRVMTYDMPGSSFGCRALNSATVIEGLELEVESKNWLISNLPFLKWASDKIYQRSINTETIRSLALLKCYAQLLPNRIITFTPFEFYGVHEENSHQIITPTANFFPFLSPTYETLQQISRREFSAEVYYYEMITTSDDPRLNHLSYANRKIIAKMFAEVFLTGDITKYDQTKPVGRLFNRQLTFDDIPLIEKG